MRKKEIHDLLKTTMQTKIPDVTNRIDFKSIVIEPKLAPSSRFKFKPRWQLMTVLAVAVISVIAILLPAISRYTRATPLTLSAASTTSFTAVSSSMLLDAKASDTGLSTLQMPLSANMYGKKPAMSNKVSTLNPYFNMIELFLVEDQLVFSTPTPSNRAGYTQMMTYTMTDLTSRLQTYTYYFSETVLANQTNVTGLIKIANIAYYLEGSKKETSQKTEIEIKTYVDSSNKDKDYIITKSTKYKKTQAFLYSVFEEGEEVEVSELKLETRGNQITIQLKYENELTDEEIEIEAVRIIRDNQAVLKVTYQIENSEIDESGEMIIYVQFNQATNNSQYVYEIKNSKGEMNEWHGPRRHKDENENDEDGDEEDDD